MNCMPKLEFVLHVFFCLIVVNFIVLNAVSATLVWLVDIYLYSLSPPL